MTGAPRVSIVVVSYNTRELTLACLRSVRDQPRNAESTQVIVVDNASIDGSADAIVAEFPDLHLLRSDKNMGFAAANNSAAAHARGTYLLLLNPDTVVLPGAIDTLVAFAEEHPRAGIWGGKTLFADRTLNPASCWSRPTPWSLLCMATGLSSLRRGSSLLNPEEYGGWKRDRVRDVDIVSGCFLLIRLGLWRALGGFDPQFFMYGEDADLCIRAAKLGARPMITPEATIIHYGGASERVRADKLVRLLEAKAKLIRRHWRPRSVRCGVFMLSLWPLTRTIVWRLMSYVRGERARCNAETWRSVWRCRGSWSSMRTEPAAQAQLAGDGRAVETATFAS